MRSIAELILELRRQGVRLFLEHDTSHGVQLRYRAPKGALTKALRREIVEQKAELIAFLQQATQRVELPPIVPAPLERYEPFPLTDIQQAYWVGRREGLELGNVAIHAYLEMECQGLDIERLNQAWNKLVSRHEMLRAIVLPSGLQQILAQVPPYQIQVSDLRELDGQPYLAVRERMSHQNFDLSQWPLFEVHVCRLGESKTRLHLSLDGTHLDGQSIKIILQEVVQFYLGTSVSKLHLSFRDYVLASLKLQETPIYQRSLNYWQNRLTTLPPTPELSLAKNPAALTSTRFQNRASRISLSSSQRLMERAAKANVTVPALLLTIYTDVLATWSKAPRFTINVPLFNRLPLDPQVNQVVGNFSSFTLVEVDYSIEKSFIERAHEIQTQLREGLEHSYVSGIRILREMYQKRGELSAGAMPVVFTSIPESSQHSNNEGATLEALGEDITFITQTPQVWLDNQVMFDEEGAISWQWDAVEELFPLGMLDDMFDAYCRKLRRLADEPESMSLGTRDWHESQSDITLIPQAQLELRALINATSAPIPEVLLHTLFATQALQQPHQTALISATCTLSYQELWKHANQLGHWLRRQGLGPNELVAVVMEKGWEQVVAVLGILSAGAAYLPIDPDQPKERLWYLLANGEVEIALTQPWLSQRLEWPEDVQPIAYDSIAFAEESSEPLKPLQQPTDLACVIYTSGSTGAPKGVMITHQGVINAIIATNQHFQIGPQDKVLALTPLIHDMSMYDIFGMLATGGTIVMPEGDNRRNPTRWVELLISEQVTTWNSVPAMMEMLLEYTLDHPWVQLPSLSRAFLGGDWIGLTIPERLKAIAENCQVISVGGPTETTLWNIWYPVESVEPTWKSIPYGKPIANTRYYVLNEAFEERPVWVPGQLYVAGVGVSPGYWRDETKTKAKFIHPPAHVTATRLYATGDLGRYLPDGNIEFLGRADFQLKIRGRRIEPGEIEATLVQHPTVQAAVVTALETNQSSLTQLIAYVVPEKQKNDPTPKPVEAIDYTQLANVIQEPLGRIEFKLKQVGLEELSGQEIKLTKPDVDDALKQSYFARQSYRKFLAEPIPFEQFSLFLSCLLQFKQDHLPLPKYRYPSGGGLYPVQTRLYVKPKRVEGLEGGFYYYHPATHRLIRTGSTRDDLEKYYVAINQATFSQSAFALFLIGKMSAVTPMYGEGEFSREICLLEAGYMGQLLMTEASKKEIGLCPVGGIAFEELRESLSLQSSHILLHSFLGGRIDSTQSKQWLQPTAQGSDAPQSQEEQWRDYLSQKLPSYMVPSAYVFLDALPLTANGKVNRKALPAPNLVERPANVPPRTPLEKEVAAIMEQMLGQSVGIHDNFFEFGGDSVIAIQLLSRLQNRFSVEYPLGEFFERPTVENVGEYIETVRWASGEGSDSFSANKQAVGANSASQIEEEVEF